MTTITDADLERMGFDRCSTSGWRKYSSDHAVCITVRGGVRAVWLEQARAVTTAMISLGHITTPQQLEALCRIVLEGQQ